MKHVRQISSGGFGEVDELLLDDGSRVARKTFAPTIALSAGERQKHLERFAREVKYQSLLSSPAFMPVLSHDLTPPNPFFVMPLAERNLDDEIRQNLSSGAIPTQALADVLNALEELHSRGFVHRDLKPQNVLFHDGTWKLTDFGLALPPTNATTRLTSTGSNWGTAQYCAPEQAVDFKGATSAVDIYAFGCILHDIFGTAARIPYQRQSAPGKIGSLIEKCTETAADRRFKNVSALRSALLPLLANSSVATASSTASNWEMMVQSGSTWDRTTIEQFARFVRHASGADRYVVLRAIDSVLLEHLLSVDQDIWKFIAIELCAWVRESSFDFGFCDVLVGRLEAVFESGDAECKAAAAVAAAELGASHNRWYVMGRLLLMCSPALDENVAERVAIEIQAEDAAENFRRSADRIGRDLSAYHSSIVAVLGG
jgi:hypothetical protein